MFCVIVKNIPEYKEVCSLACSYDILLLCCYDLLFKFVETEYSDYLKDAPRIVELEENAKHIQLRMKSTSIQSWEIDYVDDCVCI